MTCALMGASRVAAADAAAASPPPPPPPVACDPEQQPVDVIAADGGLTVTRKVCASEVTQSLVYSFGAVRNEIEGTKVGDDTWTFGITEKIPDDSLLKLEFHVWMNAADPKKARVALDSFSQALRDAVAAAAQAAMDKTKAVPGDARWTAFVALFREEATANVKKLLATHKLPYRAGKVSAAEFILDKAKFEKTAAGEWVPGAEAIDALKASIPPAAALLLNAETRIAGYTPPNPALPCLGDATKLPTDLAARQTALASCLKSLLSDASKAKVPEADLAALKELSTKTDAEVATVLVNATTIELRPTAKNVNTQLFSEDYKERLMVAASAPKDTDKSLSGPLAADNAALLYLAALQVESVTRPVLTKLLADEFLPQEVQVELVFLRAAQAHQLVRVVNGKPRFFVSTGVAVTSLDSSPGNDPNKLTIPVLVSVCFSHAGCETKGMGSGGTATSYMSLDLGVNAVFLGQKNPRQGTPSFLFGAGFTPLYATHVSLGVNIFENPQTSQANVAPYIALTLDVVDGAGILGALGIGKPTAQKISGAPTSDEKSDNNGTK